VGASEESVGPVVHTKIKADPESLLRHSMALRAKALNLLTIPSRNAVDITGLSAYYTAFLMQGMSYKIKREMSRVYAYILEEECPNCGGVVDESGKCRECNMCVSCG